MPNFGRMFCRPFKTAHRTPWLWVLALVVMGCLRTEIVPDPESSKSAPVVRVSPADTSLLSGATFQATAQYFDNFGRKQAVQPRWHSTDIGVIHVTASGTIAAIADGQAYAVATVQDTIMGTALITVVNNTTDVARVVVSAPTTLTVTEAIQLSATAYTLTGTVVPGITVQWQSSNIAVATVSVSGLLSAVGSGTTLISAVVNGITSLPISLTVVPGERVARIMPGPIAGEAARGTARIVRLSSGALELRFDADFATDNGPSLFVYLANCNLLSFSNLNTCTRVELGTLKSISGAQSYAIPASVGINEYSHVLVHCKPFVVTFGTGRFE